MTSTTYPAPIDAAMRLTRASVALAVPSLLLFAYLGTFVTTTDGGDFQYAADYWYTAVGLPISLAGIGLVLGIHRLHRGADGRLGTVGTWLTTFTLTALFFQLAASVIAGSELRLGPSYVVLTLLNFVGVALVAAGSWRTGLLPRWMLGIWPVIWILGTFAAVGLSPLVLAAFLLLLVVTLTRRVQRPAQRSSRDSAAQTPSR